jgi:hypothetical protein
MFRGLLTQTVYAFLFSDLSANLLPANVFCIWQSEENSKNNNFYEKKIYCDHSQY